MIFLYFFGILNLASTIVAYSWCGTSGYFSGFIVNGTQSKQGEWPWMIALFNTETNKFFCGGTLISDDMVLTAAHCVRGKGVKTARKSHEIIVKAGRHDISASHEPNADSVPVKNIIVHENWNIHTTPYDSDIAVLVLKRKIQISHTIFPICLPTQDDPRVLKAQKGIVAGWGVSVGLDTPEDILRQTTIGIIDYEQCLFEDQKIAKLLSRNAICGGTSDASGPCKGDSGGGLVVKVNSKWFLRGIVSAGSITNDQCDVNSKVVYTDVIKFITWILQVADDHELSIQPTQTTNENEIFCFFESWAQWRADDGAFTVHDFPHELCTKAVYLHAELDGDSLKTIHEMSDISRRNKYHIFIRMKKLNPNLKVLMAVGSYNEGSEVYSKLAASSTRRTNFAKNVVQFLLRFGFDGIHLHWEFPAHRGGSSDDRENLVLLLKELKTAFTLNQLYLSVMVRTITDEVQKAYDMKSIAKYADAICLFTQDLDGSWNHKVGWNAALYGPGENTVESRVNYMLTQGVPAEKMLMALPFYGQTFVTTHEGKIGDASPSGFPGPLSGYPGFSGFIEICHLKRMKPSWTEKWDATANEMIAKYHEHGTNYVITYDSPRSIANKVKFMKEKNLGGVWVWFVTSDDFKAQCPADHTTFADFPLPLRPISRKERDFPLLRTVNEAMERVSN